VEYVTTPNKEDKLGFALILTIVGSFKTASITCTIPLLASMSAAVTLAPPFEAPPFTTISDLLFTKNLNLPPGDAVADAIKQMF
jgi:hypothetical protein